MALKVGVGKSSAGAEHPRLTWRDGLSYGLAWLAWLALAVAFAAALQAVRSTIGPLALAILLRNASEPRHFFNLGGQAFIADRVGLVVLGLLWLVYVFLTEDYLRSSVATARALRLRAASADAPAPDFTRGWLRQHGLVELARRTAIAAAFPVGAAIIRGWLRQHGLVELARRTAIAAAFPVGAAIIYGLLQGLLWLITR